MPLIRWIRNWVNRRLVGAATSGAMPADGGVSLSTTSWLWLIVLVVIVPINAVLVLIGLIYELVIRIDRRRLGSTIEWALASIAAVALLVGSYVVLFPR